MLSKMSEPINHANWCSKLSEVEYAINNSIHVSTGDTPSQLLFGVSQRGIIVDELKEYLDNKNVSSNNYNVMERRLGALERIQRSQRYNEENFLRHTVAAKVFSVGDFVYVRSSSDSMGKSGKLSEKYRGPYMISNVLDKDRYIVEDIENCPISEIPYKAIIESRNLKLWLEK